MKVLEVGAGAETFDFHGTGNEIEIDIEKHQRLDAALDKLRACRNFLARWAG